MSGRILSADTFGNLVEVQCKLTKGLPSMQIVGLGNKAVDESKERVRAAFHSLKLPFPKGRILVNLSPADLPKDGSSYDLSVAYAILVASGAVPIPKKDVLLFGELSLEGKVVGVRGIIGRLRSMHLASDTVCIIPDQNATQASLVPDKIIIPIVSLMDLVDISSGAKKPIYSLPGTLAVDKPLTASLFDEVRGQQLAKRALQIAAAGNHNILLFGPPGTGKSMLAKALTEILPSLTVEECLESTHIHSLRSPDYDTLISQPPLRSPHHSASNVAILGGGPKARPGEVSLAHNGVLFLDELLEFGRSCIEALRQPLEDRVIHVSRAEHTVTYPASFLMIATMNPCPCGNLGSKKECICSGYAIQAYQKKLSGPIADRIDLFVKVDDVGVNSLLDAPVDTNVATIRKNVASARTAQYLRNKGKLNSTLGNSSIRSLSLEPSARALLESAAEKMGISPRAYFRVVRVAQTIADLDQKDTIDDACIAESLQFRKNMPVNS